MNSNKSKSMKKMKIELSLMVFTRALYWVHYFFIIYIDDLPDFLKEQLLYGYAEDNKVISTNHTAMSQTCSNIALWCSVNCIRLNEWKSKLE